VTPRDFEWLRKLLKERSGLTLTAEKQYLLESRLLPLARRHGIANLSELVARLQSASAATLAIEVVEAMATNETFFFRDKIPFDLLEHTILPALIEARAREKRIRIWCAAAASGQEPYSIAMVLKSMAARLRGYRVDLLATDLCSSVLEKAKVGIYNQFEVQRGLPIQLLVRYFGKVGECWQITPELRAMVQFRPLNLLHDFAPLGRFDLVFCRNVLIYFDPPTKLAMFERLVKAIEPDGMLMLGAAESVVGVTDAFRPYPDRRGLYQPNPARGQRPSLGAMLPVLKAVGAR
jgi:chemotaxis protein methyltransferase CheR